jgi:hypothetical protein
MMNKKKELTDEELRRLKEKYSHPEGLKEGISYLAEVLTPACKRLLGREDKTDA